MRIIPNPALLWQFISARLMALPHQRALLALLGAAIGLMVVVVVGILVLMTTYAHRIYPGIRIGPVVVSGMTQSEALEALALAVRSYRSHWPITFTYNGNPVVVPLPDEAVAYDLEQAVARAYTMGRSSDTWSIDTLVSLAEQSLTIPIPITVNEMWLASESARIAAETDESPLEAHVAVIPTALGPEVSLQDGKDGLVFHQESWRKRVVKAVTELTIPETSLEVSVVSQHVTQTQKEAALGQAQRLLNHRLRLAVPNPYTFDTEWEIEGADLVAFVDIERGYNYSLLSDYVEAVAESVNRPAKDAKFEFDEATGKVSEFVPAEAGLQVDVAQTVEAIVQQLSSLSDEDEVTRIAITVNTTMPDVSLSEVNRLGIKERIGVGRSTYKGSIPSRVHNVALAASRIHGTLVKPGEEFSFNQAVGEISAATGYQAAYIIQNGRTVLGDGGGVCQDSTTVFRAALDAGLPITMRRGHAYRVGYYEQDTKPGIDATVYSPTTDFRFLNDTPGHILIQTSVDTPNRALTVTLYGTSDGRTSTIQDHVIWDVTPPPPDVYVDDPTLPTGTTKQVDWKAPGTKAKFTYVVERNGAVILEKTFTTVYRPWASVFLRGTRE